MMKNEHGRIDLLTQKQIDWCNINIKRHESGVWFAMDDGKIYSSVRIIKMMENDDTEKFPVKFGNCETFLCSYFKKLKSLEGSPDNVTENFSIYYADSLETLKGSPIEIGGSFDIGYCDKLVNAKGTTKRILQYLDFYNCEKLESLEEIPEYIEAGIIVKKCPNMKIEKKLKKTYVGGSINLRDCEKIDSIDGLMDVSIEGTVWVNDEMSKKYGSILEYNDELVKWQKSGMKADDYMREYSGYFDAKKYGI